MMVLEYMEVSLASLPCFCSWSCPVAAYLNLCQQLFMLVILRIHLLGLSAKINHQNGVGIYSKKLPSDILLCCISNAVEKSTPPKLSLCCMDCWVNLQAQNASLWHTVCFPESVR